MTFSLTPEEQEKVSQWLYSEVYPEIVSQQIKHHPESITTDEQGRQIPYLGAIGGGLTYMFTPTSLGTVIEVVSCMGHPTWERRLNITDFDSW